MSISKYSLGQGEQNPIGLHFRALGDTPVVLISLRYYSLLEGSEVQVGSVQQGPLK